MFNTWTINIYIYICMHLHLHVYHVPRLPHNFTLRSFGTNSTPETPRSLTKFWFWRVAKPPREKGRFQASFFRGELFRFHQLEQGWFGRCNLLPTEVNNCRSEIQKLSRTESSYIRYTHRRPSPTNMPSSCKINVKLPSHSDELIIWSPNVRNLRGLVNHQLQV